MSIPFEIRRVERQLGRIIPCDGAYGQAPFRGLDWREINIWCPIEWVILGKTFLAKGIVPQELLDIWDEICTSLHWDPSGRPYEGWIQCLLMALLGSLHDAPCVDTTCCRLFTHLDHVAEIFKPLGVSLGASLESRLSPCS